MNDALVEAWYVNHRINLKLLDELPDEALRCTLSKRGGRTVGQQMVHMIDVRRFQLEGMDKALVAGLVPITREDGHDRALVRRAFEVSADAVAQVLADAPIGGRIKGFKRGAVAFFGYLVAHDAHHRGNILLTIKESGIQRPESLKYGLWEWNRI